MINPAIAMGARLTSAIAVTTSEGIPAADLLQMASRFFAQTIFGCQESGCSAAAGDGGD
jgi:hypothetical protein